MSPARPRNAAVLLAASLLIVLLAAPGADGACNATCSRDLARCMATQCAGVGREACRRRCKPAAIRTLAYVLSECRVDAAGFIVGRQALRIRRGDREPITVVEFGPSEPFPDLGGGCRFYGGKREGVAAVLYGALQRLGVSPDGSGVVFEVNGSVLGRVLPPEQEGLFFVRSDGSGQRYLGLASHDPSFRVGIGFNSSPPVPFSPNGRRIAFTDLGPGPGGEEAAQIVVLDLATGQRARVTRLPSGTPPGPQGENFFTCCPQFIDDETVLFRTFADPDGSNPKHNFAAFTVRIDGSRLKPLPLPSPVVSEESRIVPNFEVLGRGTNLATLTLPGTPLNPVPPFVTPIAEVFVQNGKNILQLTTFGRVDTFGAFLSPSRTRAFFRASADPLGMNRYGICQIFSIDTLGSGLRQVTRFTEEPVVKHLAPCDNGESCQLGGRGGGWLTVQDPVTKAVVFRSNCDPLHANPFGDQVFAVRPDGSGLRQLTDAAGFTTNPDGSIRVELPGPFAYSTGPH